VSARTRRGIDALVARTLAPAGDPGGPAAGPRAPPRGSGSPRFLTSAYQEARLAEADEALARAGAALRAGEGAEYAAADLRDALRALDELAGATPREAVLDCIFSRFCVGK
jgi:tRNA modification GTPase